MMHYRKGENVEQELSKDQLPFEDCMPTDKDFLWMHVKGGTHVSNVITHAKNAFEKGDYRTVVWSGSGGGIGKTISCAEIMKRSFTLYQVTRMCYVNVEEHWKPQMEGLEEIIAKRQIPCLHILMSFDTIETVDVQKPFTAELWQEPNYRQKHSNANQLEHPSGSDSQSHKRPRQGWTNAEPQQQQKQQRQHKQRQQQQQQLLPVQKENVAGVEVVN